MRNKLVAIVIAIVSIFGLAACETQDTAKTDIKEPKVRGKALPTDFSAQAPDVLTVYMNVDGHPTVVKLCLDGVAFRTISNSHQGGLSGAVERVPEWDGDCK